MNATILPELVEYKLVAPSSQNDFSFAYSFIFGFVALELNMLYILIHFVVKSHFGRHLD